MKLTFLGTGTSSGVPVMGCHCKVCDSSDSRDKRLRCAALLETEGTRILIDAGPDIRQQLMPFPFTPLSAVLLTHIHYDHVGGLDDLRGFCKFGPLHVYGDEGTIESLRVKLPYCFMEHLYPGVPLLSVHPVHPYEPFFVDDVEIIPIEVMHGKLPILGYRIGKLAYITDMKTIEEQAIPYLEGVETLVVNALRFERPHHSHQLVDDAIRFSRQIGAHKTYLVHVTHEIGLHDEANARLPENVYFPYDGQSIEV